MRQAVVSTHGSLARVNRNGETGVTVPPGDHEAPPALRTLGGRDADAHGRGGADGGVGASMAHNFAAARAFGELVETRDDEARFDYASALGCWPAHCCGPRRPSSCRRRPRVLRQERVGEGGRIFRALKFRSMRPDAEASTGPIQATARSTRHAHRARQRATAMDERRATLNILSGDMSFVGPRALRPGEIEAAGNGAIVRVEDVPGFTTRISVRPGLTGIAQIYARRDVPRRHKFRYDRLYVRRRSWLLDVRLILLSFWISFRGTWEARGKKF